MRNTVIIGNSAAGINALESFRKYEADSPVTLISEEPGPAYSRVLLPYYLRKEVSFKNLFIRRRDYYKRMRVNTHFGEPVRQIEVKKQCVRLKSGTVIPFDRLLIATGAHPVKPPVQNLAGPGVHHLWTLEDAQKLDSLLHPGKRALILGSGFVALQAAWAVLRRGLEVTVFELMSRIMPRVLDDQGASILHQKILRHGVDLRTEILTEGIERCQDGTIRVFAKGYPPFSVDAIIVGTGVRPNVGFLQDSPVEINGGILVNSKMESSARGIYAAGDVALGATVFNEAHTAHALWPTAVEHGKIAGANMAGKDLDYRGSLNMNVTEMFGITVASMGIFQSCEAFENVSHIDPGKGRYIKILLRDQKPVGGIILGTPEDVKLLGALRPFIRRNMTVNIKERFIKECFYQDLMENMFYFRRLIA